MIIKIKLKFFLALIFIIIFCTLIPREAFADGIKIDGKFSDWKDMPYIRDPKDDMMRPWLDFKEVRYFSDDQYLYLYVERESAKQSQSWEFQVVILNALKEKNYTESIPVKYVYDKKHKDYRPSRYEKIAYGKFDITIGTAYNHNSKETAVTVSFEGDLLETTLSVHPNKKIIEFRIPLKAVGLDGMNKEVKFMLKSAYDWMPNGKPIIITTASTFGKILSIILFTFVSFIVYHLYRINIIKK